mgnify:CR=1 FL=1
MEAMLKEAKLKALRLLTAMDRTEEQLRQKLKQKEYPDDVVEQAIAYVKSFGYINDANYAKRFVDNRKGTKSKRELRAALQQRGIDTEHIEAAFAEVYSSDDALEAIQRIVSKRKFSVTDCDEIEKKKLFAYLARKGFQYEDIRKVLEVSL